MNAGVRTETLHPVLFAGETERILFDTGCPGHGQALEEELRKLDLSVKELTRVVVSHQDHDHMGALAELKRGNPRLEVIASEEEAPFISGERTSLRVEQAEAFNQTLTGEARVWGEGFLRYLKTVVPCPVDRTVRDGELIVPGLRAVATQGHTPGHLSLFLEKEGILAAGDALALEEGKPVIANPQFTLDLQEAAASIRKIASLSPRLILCCHGGRWETGEAGAAGITRGLEALLETL